MRARGLGLTVHRTRVDVAIARLALRLGLDPARALELGPDAWARALETRRAVSSATPIA